MYGTLPQRLLAFIKVCLDSGTTFIRITCSCEVGHLYYVYIMESTVHLPVQKDVTSIESRGKE
jgi:hypothetical protein